MVISGRSHLAGGNDEAAVNEAKIDLSRQPALACNGVRADVGAREDGCSPHLARGPQGLSDHVALTYVERTAKLSERRIEVDK